jgi:hypothetical protein
MASVVIAATMLDFGIVYMGEEHWMAAHALVWVIALMFCFVIMSKGDAEDE